MTSQPFVGTQKLYAYTCTLTITHTYTPWHTHSHAYALFLQFLMTVSAVFVLMTHVLTKPYVKTHINIIETLILLNLAAVTVVYLNPSVNHVPQWLTALLVLLPFAYCLVYILWRISGYVWYVDCLRNYTI